MSELPDEVTRFLERSVPIFTHLAAVQQGGTPLLCRGYGFRLDFESENLWIYILKNQWLRLKESMGRQKELSALLTSGVDNESYQFKGRFMDFRPLTKEDVLAMEGQRRWISLHTPGLVPLVHVAPSECLAVGFRIRSVFSQTPGTGAGFLVAEWKDE